jgi:hypothetical protein
MDSTKLLFPRVKLILYNHVVKSAKINCVRFSRISIVHARNEIDDERLPGINDWFFRILPTAASTNKQIKEWMAIQHTSLAVAKHPFPLLPLLLD